MESYWSTQMIVSELTMDVSRLNYQTTLHDMMINIKCGNILQNIMNKIEINWNAKLLADSCQKKSLNSTLISSSDILESELHIIKQMTRPKPLVFPVC